MFDRVHAGFDGIIERGAGSSGAASSSNETSSNFMS